MSPSAATSSPHDGDRPGDGEGLGGGDVPGAGDEPGDPGELPAGAGDEAGVTGGVPGLTRSTSTGLTLGGDGEPGTPPRPVARGDGRWPATEADGVADGAGLP